MTDPVLSRDDHVWHQPDGSPRRYLLAPLTRRERNLARRDMVAEGARFPGDAAVYAALREALREIAPANFHELLALVDASEAEADVAARTAEGSATRRLAPVEQVARVVPGFAALLADREFYMATLPAVFARHALRGWDGDGLPPFERRNGIVPDALLDLIPDAEISSLGFHAHDLAHPTRGAAKNSVPLSPSPESPAPGTAT
jgi:hypothetical protein